MLSLVAYQNSDESESETEENSDTNNEQGKRKEKRDDSSSKIDKSTLLTFATPGRSKETVKITVPSLKAFEDDEKDEPLSKKVKKSSGSGLLSMLPPPKYSKLGSAQKSFVPYVLTKKPLPSTKPSMSVGSTGGTNKSLSMSVGSTGGTNKSLSMSVGSTGGTKQLKKPTLSVKERTKNIMTHSMKSFEHSKQDSNVIERESHSPPVSDFFSLHEPSHQQNRANVSVSSTSDVLESPASVAKLTQDFVHSSNAVGTASYPSSSVNSLFWQSKGVHTNVSSSEHHGNCDVKQSASWQSQHVSSSAEPSEYSQSCMADQSLGDHPSSEGVYSTYPGIESNTMQYTRDERFLRLHSKRRGQEEINIIDVSVDDQLTDKTEWLTKSITEEKVHHSSHKKDDMPTQLQKRKHQITYLAFQAKERELELKNQWSQNRLTKRETQAKYGF